MRVHVGCVCAHKHTNNYWYPANKQGVAELMTTQHSTCCTCDHLMPECPATAHRPEMLFVVMFSLLCRMYVVVLMNCAFNVVSFIQVMYAPSHCVIFWMSSG
jgi:hypothetical protein